MERLIIDTDPGEDDALAIMMAAAHPNAQIDALTVVAGNVGLAHTTNNAGVILDVLGLDVPLYAGCERPFVQAPRDAAYAHGQDGLGNTGYKSDRAIEPAHAAIELVRRASEAPQTLTLVLLGPMTNLATALKLDPTLPQKFKRVIAMAGAVTARGNVNNCAEFNVIADPEAAHVVFTAWAEAQRQIELADWELTMRHGFTKEILASWEAIDTPKAAFFTAISAHSNQFIQEVRRRTTQYFADPVAMAVALEPAIVVQAEQHHLAIELSGTQTRGQTVVDWFDSSNQPPNTRIALRLDHARLLALVAAALE
ncbi:MAG: nucleoside hydrolase [Chloroflexota bacterium]